MSKSFFLLRLFTTNVHAAESFAFRALAIIISRNNATNRNQSWRNDSRGWHRPTLKVAEPSGTHNLQKEREEEEREEEIMPSVPLYRLCAENRYTTWVQTKPPTSRRTLDDAILLLVRKLLKTTRSLDVCSCRGCDSDRGDNLAADFSFLFFTLVQFSRVAPETQHKLPHGRGVLSPTAELFFFFFRCVAPATTRSGLFEVDRSIGRSLCVAAFREGSP